MSTHYGYGKTAMGYDAYTGTNGLQVSSPCWPTPSTSGETMDKVKAWLDKPVMTSTPNFKNKHLAIGATVAAVAGLAWYGHRNHWF
jgi:hypothetical protein